MKKTLIILPALLLTLAGCGGNKLGIDEEKAQKAVIKEALEQKVIQEGNYKSSDIELVKVCEAVEKGKEDYGYDGNYITYWQTKDKKYQRTFLLKDYKALYGDVNFKAIDDRCIDIK